MLSQEREILIILRPTRFSESNKKKNLNLDSLKRFSKKAFFRRLETGIHFHFQVELGTNPLVIFLIVSSHFFFHDSNFILQNLKGTDRDCSRIQQYHLLKSYCDEDI